MTKCPVCNKKKAVLDPRFGVLPCRACRTRQRKHTVIQTPTFMTVSERDRIVQQQDRNARDIIQPFMGNKPNPEFIRAYPQYAQNYYSKEELNKYEK